MPYQPLAEVRKTLRVKWYRSKIDHRQKTDPDYFFDTPLPATAKHVRTEVPDMLESSIGVLAPKGLK